MKLLLLSLLIVASAIANPKPAPPPSGGGPQVITLAAKKWTISGSYFGRSENPSRLSTGGFYFDFPDHSTGKYAGYLTTTSVQPIYGSATLSVTIQVLTTGSPVFMYDSEPFNTCPTPATVRPFFWTGGWGEFDRWWSNPTSYTLAAGYVMITVPLTPDQWSSVNGKFGNFDAASSAGFTNALQNTSTIGLTFGGGCFFAHGVSVLNGTAQFQVLDYRTQ